MTNRSTKLCVLAAALTVALTAGCSGTRDDAPTPPIEATDTSAFPVTITSSLGSAQITEAPTRIATWGWSNQDALLALGVVPVAMPTFSDATYGADDRGILQWDAAKLAELGGPTPTLLSGDGTGEVPVEQFAQADPDLIFAPYSGLTQQEFDALSQIAPVVGYPDQPWTSSWEDQLTIAGTALGKQQEAADLVNSIGDSIERTAAKYPALAGKTVTIALPNSPGTFTVSKPGDVRVEFLGELGLVPEPSIEQADTAKDADAVYFELSLEQAALVKPDVLFVVAYSKDELQTFLAQPTIAGLPVVAEGRTASTQQFTVAENFAFGGLTALTIPYVLDKVAFALNDAAARIQG